ncbi:MAG: NUDIX hydrolase [Anaerolineaceae bacterium]|nr:NUDIX hydrolase [Anaerolineaceae bacterium]
MPAEYIDSQILYQGRAFRLMRDRVRLPDGREASFDVVQHVGAVTLIPVDGDGRIYFVKQYRSGLRDTLLELPAGTLEPDEPHAICAAREVREEIGMAADQLELIGEVWMAPGYSTEYMYFYLATGLYSAPLNADADEFLEILAIPLAEAYALVWRGELKDGKTLAALLLARPRLEAMFPGQL